MKFKESVITNEPIKGLTTFIIPTKVRDVVTISGSMLGGTLFSNPKNNKIAKLKSLGSNYNVYLFRAVEFTLINQLLVFETKKLIFNYLAVYSCQHNYFQSHNTDSSNRYLENNSFVRNNSS